MSSEPRWKIFSTPSTLTREPFLELGSLISLIDFLDGRAVGQCGRGVHRDAFAGGHARAENEIVILRTGNCHRAALGPRVLNDEHNVMTVLIAQGGLGDAHGMFGRRRAGFAEGD